MLLHGKQQLLAQCGFNNIAPNTISTTVCSESTVKMQVGITVKHWIYRDNHAGNWIFLDTGAYNYSDQYHIFQTVSVSIPTIRSYRAIISSQICPNDTTAATDITITPILYRNNNNIHISTNNSNVCSGSQFSLNMLPGTSILTWLYSDNNSTWNAYGFITQNFSASVTLNSDTVLKRSFKALVNYSNSCLVDSSASIKITVLPNVAGNNTLITPFAIQPTVCKGDIVSLQVDWKHEVESWIYKDAGSTTWQNLNTTTAYTKTNVSDRNTNINPTIREYRVILKRENSCWADTSNSCFVSIGNANKRVSEKSPPNLVLPTSISKVNPIICAGDSVVFNNNSQNISWIYKDSVNGIWTVFGSSSGNSPYLSSNKYINKDLYREVRVVSFSSSTTCNSDTSAPVFYKINAIKFGNTTLIPNTPINVLSIGSRPVINLQNGQPVSNWIYRDNGIGDWISTNSGGNSFTDYSTRFLNANTLRSYKTIFYNTGNCSIDTTLPVTIHYKTPTPNGVINIMPKPWQPNYCTGAMVNVRVKLGVNMEVVKWIYKDDTTTNWLDLLSGPNTNINDFNTHVTTITNRTYRAIILSLETFTTDTTLGASVIIKPYLIGNSNVTPTANTTSICMPSTIDIKVNEPEGYVLWNWYYRDSISTNWLMSQIASSTLRDNLPSNINQRFYKAVLYNENQCLVDTTNVFVLNGLPKISRSNSKRVPTVINNTVCAGTPYNVSIHYVTNTAIYKWITRDNGGPWQESETLVNYFSENGNNTNVLATTIREYKVIMDGDECFRDTSASVFVTINPYSNGSSINIKPSTSNSTLNLCSGKTINAQITYPGTIQKWVYKKNDDDWANVPVTLPYTNVVYHQPIYVDTNTTMVYRAYLNRPNTCLVDTSLSVTFQVNPFKYGNIAVVIPTTATNSICAGSAATVTIEPAIGTQVYKWIYRDEITEGWKDFKTITEIKTLIDNYTNVAENTLRNYRAIINSSNCSLDTTQMVGIQIKANSFTTQNAMSFTTDKQIYCSSNTIKLSQVGATLPYQASIKSWIYRDNNSGVWNVIPYSTTSSLSHTNTSVITPTSREYRMLVNNLNSCTIDSSGIYTVSINTPIAGNAPTITPIISGLTNCNYYSKYLPYPYLPSSNNVVKWLVNTNNNGWTDWNLEKRNLDSIELISAPHTPFNKLFRGIILNTNSCSLDTTNIGGSNFIYPVAGNYKSVIPTSTSTIYCYANPVNVNINIPAGFAVEKWIYKDNNQGWNNFAFSTNTSILIDSNSYVTSLTNRVYCAILFNASNCQRDSTATIAVTIKPLTNYIATRTITPTSSPNNKICSGTSVALNVLPNNEYALTKWIYSDNGTNGAWVDAIGSIGLNSFTHQLTHVDNTTARLYKAIVTNLTTCNLDSTNAILVNINKNTFGTDSNITVSGTDACIEASANLWVTPGNGNAVFKWIYKDSNGVWLAFPSSEKLTSIIDNTKQFKIGETRTYSPLILKTSTCKVDTLIKVKSITYGTIKYGYTSTNTYINVDTICAGSYISSGVNGSYYAWFFRDGNVGSWTKINRESSSLYDKETNVKVSGWRYYKVLLNTDDCTRDTATIDSVYIKLPTYGNIAVNLTTTTASVCAGSRITIVLSSGKRADHWLYRDNGIGPWLVIPNSTETVLFDNNTFVTVPTIRQYHAIVIGNCSFDSSNVISVNINPITAARDSTLIPTVNRNSICAIDSLQNIKVSLKNDWILLKWLYRDNGGAWQLFALGNQNNLTDFNTRVNTTVIRDYLAVVFSSSACRIDTSAILSVTIRPIGGGTSSSSVNVTNSICMENDYWVGLTVSAGNSIIGLLSSYNGGLWFNEGNITPTTSLSISKYAYTGSPYTVGYRAVIYNESNCNIDTTVATLRSINKLNYGSNNTITPTGSTINCSGSEFILSPRSSYYSGFSHWVYSDDAGVTWTPQYNLIPNKVFTNTAINRLYRAIINSPQYCSIDTTAAKSVLIKPYTYGYDTITSMLVSYPSPVCFEKQISRGIDPYQLDKIWLYNDNNTGWKEDYTNGAITYLSSPINRVYSALINNKTLCSMDTIVKTDTIFIIPRSYATDTSFIITTSGNICDGSALTLNVNAATSLVQSWHYSDNGEPWKLITNEKFLATVIDSNTGVIASTTRRYMALIKQLNTCTIDTTKITTVTINPRVSSVDTTITPTVISSSVCAGRSISINTKYVAGNTIQQWIYRENGGAWMVHSKTQSASIFDYKTDLTSSVTRDYRVLINRANTCTTDTSNLVSVTINPMSNGNQNNVVPVTSKATICSGASVTISVNISSSSTILGWLYRDNNSSAWLTFESNSSSIIDKNTLTSTQITRQYRALINNAVLSCRFDTSNLVSVIIYPMLTGNQNNVVPVASKATICSGSLSSLSVSGFSGSGVIGWLYRDNINSAWLTTGTSSTILYDYNTQTSTQITRQYRAIINNTLLNCSFDTTNIVSVIINPIVNGNVAIATTSTKDTICSGSAVTLNIIPGAGKTVINWLYKDEDMPWVVLSSNTSVTVNDVNTFISNASTRLYRTLLSNTANCSIDSSIAVAVVIKPINSPINLGVLPNTSTPKVCSGGTALINITGFDGAIAGWIYSDDFINWYRIIGLTTPSINYPINVSRAVTRQVKALIANACSTDTTGGVTLTLDTMPTKPTVSNKLGTDTLICNQTATAYQWFLNNSLIPGATSQIHIATVNGTYSVQVTNNATCQQISDGYVHSLVGLENIFANTLLWVYPNPTNTGMVTIQWQGLAITNATIFVTDLLGKHVLQNKIKAQSADNINIDLSQHNGGLYFITITANGQSITRKVSYLK